MKRSELFFTFILIPADFIAIFLAFLFAYLLRLKWDFLPVSYMWPLDQYLRFTFILIPIWLLVFALSGLYRISNIRKGISGEFAPLLLAVSTGMLLVTLYIFFSRSFFFSRLVLIYAWILAIFFVLTLRYIIRTIQRYLYRYSIGVHRIALIGTGDVAQNIIMEIQNNKRLGYQLIGIIIKDTSQKPQAKKIYKVLGTLSQLDKIIKENRPIDEIILANSAISEADTLKLIEYTKDKKIIFKHVPGLFEVHSTNISVSTLSGLPILEFRRTPLDGWGAIVKRIIDLLGATVALLIFSPLFLIIPILIKLDSRGPVFFKQKRLSPDGPFIFYKFRTMYAGAEKEHEKYVKKFGIMFKLKNDPRMTRFGKFLRRTSWDELPQFFNVLRGDMSLVGPRPPMPEEVRYYTKWQRKRLDLKPGMTGLWQVSGRSQVLFDQWVKLDLYYIENWSLALDLQIILKTFWIIIRGIGAY